MEKLYLGRLGLSALAKHMGSVLCFSLLRTKLVIFTDDLVLAKLRPRIGFVRR